MTGKTETARQRVSGTSVVRGSCEVNEALCTSIILFSIETVTLNGKGYGNNGGKITSTVSICEHSISHL